MCIALSHDIVHLLDHYMIVVLCKTSPIASPMRCVGHALPALQVVHLLEHRARPRSRRASCGRAHPILHVRPTQSNRPSCVVLQCRLSIMMKILIIIKAHICPSCPVTIEHQECIPFNNNNKTLTRRFARHNRSTCHGTQVIEGGSGIAPPPTGTDCWPCGEHAACVQSAGAGGYVPAGGGYIPPILGPYSRVCSKGYTGDGFTCERAAGGGGH